VTFIHSTQKHLLIGVCAVVIIIGLLTCGLMGKCHANEQAKLCLNRHDEPVNCDNASVFPDDGPFAPMQGALRKGSSLDHPGGTLKTTDFEHLSFAKPGDSTYGSNPAFEIFNPSGPFRVPLIKGEVFPNLLHNVGNPDSRVVYTIYRWPDKRDYLYAVITDVRPWICRAASFNHEVSHVDLQPNSSGPILQPSNTAYMASFGCLHDANGVWYSFTTLAARYQPGVKQ
jgi:hypothetical protein